MLSSRLINLPWYLLCVWGSQGTAGNSSFYLVNPLEVCHRAEGTPWKSPVSRYKILLTVQTFSGLPENTKELGMIYIGQLMLLETTLWQ